MKSNPESAARAGRNRPRAGERILVGAPGARLCAGGWPEALPHIDIEDDEAALIEQAVEEEAGVGV